MSSLKVNLITAAIFIAPLASLGAAYQLGTAEEVSITVQDKERINTSDSSSYMVYTDQEVFRNADALFHLKFSSHDLYAKLKPGSSYDCTVYGWRVPFFSMTRNIVECRKA